MHHAKLAAAITGIVRADNDFYLFEDEVAGNRGEIDKKYDFRMDVQEPRPLEIKLIPHINVTRFGLVPVGD